MLRRLVVLLLVCFAFTSVHAQTNVDFAQNDFVLVTSLRLPVYTQAFNTGTIAAEMLRGMRSRVLDIAENSDGTIWLYLEDYAYGWVPTVIDGEPTMMLYSQEAISQMMISAEEAVETNPSDAEGYVWRGTISMILNQEPHLSIGNYSIAIRIEPDNASLLEYRGRARFNSHEWRLAADDFELAIEMGRQQANTYNRAAIAYESLGNYREAIDYLEQALEVAPDYGILTGNIGNQYYNMGDYDTALDYYEQGLVIDRHLTYLYAYIGDIYEVNGDYARALQEYNAGVDIDPDCYECLRFRGIFYSEIYGDSDAAIADFRAANLVNPYDESAFINLGVVQMQTGDSAGALDSFKTAAVLNPNNDVIFYNLGSLYGHQGEYENALENYNHVVDLVDDYAHSALLYRAQIYLALEDYENAIWDADIYIEGLADGPQNMYFSAAGRMALSAAYAYIGEYDRAQRRIEQAFDTASDFVINYNYYGEGYSVTPLRLDEAFVLVDQYENGSPNAGTALQIANLLFEYGYWELAHTYYEEYVDLSGSTSSDLLDFIDFLEELYN